MEVSQELYERAFKNTTTYYEVSDDDPDLWEEFSLLNEDATKEEANAYVKVYASILGQGDNEAGIAALQKKIEEVKSGIKSGAWIDEDAYNKKFDE